MLLIVEGQLKSQLKSGFVWNSDLMRPMGEKRERGGKGIKLERRKDILCVYSVVIPVPVQMYRISLCCGRRQHNAAQSQSRSEKHLWQEWRTLFTDSMNTR